MFFWVEPLREGKEKVVINYRKKLYDIYDFKVVIMC